MEKPISLDNKSYVILISDNINYIINGFKCKQWFIASSMYSTTTTG